MGQAWMNTNMNFTKSCAFIDKSGFYIIMRRGRALFKKGTEAIIPALSIRVVSHAFIGAISIIGVVNIAMRVPLPRKKIKIQGGKKKKKSSPTQSPIS